MKGGTVYSNGHEFYALDNADEYNRLEAALLNFLHDTSETARNFLDGILKKPGQLFDSNFLYRNHDVIQNIFHELNPQQQATFIDMLQNIVAGRLNTRHGVLDTGHADQVILMNNILILFGYDRINSPLLIHSSIPQGRLRATILAEQDEVEQEVVRQIRKRRIQGVGRDAARKQRMREVARDAAIEGLRRNVLRGIIRTRAARNAHMPRTPPTRKRKRR